MVKVSPAMIDKSRHLVAIFSLVIVFFAAPDNTFAGQEEDQCLVDAILAAEDNSSAEEIRALCAAEDKRDTPLESRFFMEEKNTGNQFAITPHKPNYFLPLSYNSHPNQEPFVDTSSDEELGNEEFLFQLSMKIAIWEQVLGHRSNVFFAYSGRFWWQAYNSEISAPFRETNHEPEIFISFEPRWDDGQGRTGLPIGHHVIGFFQNDGNITVGGFGLKRGRGQFAQLLPFVALGGEQAMAEQAAQPFGKTAVADKRVGLVGQYGIDQIRIADQKRLRAKQAELNEWA